MSQKTNTTAIGLFIVTGLALGVGGLLLFSSSRLFTRTLEVITYFDESLNGLNEGAPVKYRGVTIGEVKRVMVRFNQAEDDYAMPVILELQERLLQDRLGERLDAFDAESMGESIESGLRASLQTESLVTGVLYVDIRPNTNAPPVRLHQIQKLYPELPTEPTQIQKLFNNLAGLEIKRIEENLNAVLVTLDERLRSLDMAAINRDVTRLLQSVDQLLSSPEITNSLVTLRGTLDEYRELGENLNQRIDPISDRLTRTLDEAETALAQFRGAAEDLRSQVGPDSPTMTDLDQALRQLAAAAQSLSSFLDLLKRQPNALLTGRATPSSQP